MNNDARERVLTNLRTANQAAPAEIPVTGQLPPLFTKPEEKINRLKELMTAVQTEVHLTSVSQLMPEINKLLPEKGIKTLLYAPDTKAGKKLQKAVTEPIKLVRYSGNIEAFKEELFKIDAAITTTKGGIADTGAIILWPSPAEPRLMSLVPPIHIAILEADKIYADFIEAIEKTNWITDAPANAILISGPSKTADIELILAYGVHGPKELIVFIVQ